MKGQVLAYVLGRSYLIDQVFSPLFSQPCHSLFRSFSVVVFTFLPNFFLLYRRIHNFTQLKRLQFHYKGIIILIVSSVAITFLFLHSFFSGCSGLLLLFYLHGGLQKKISYGLRNREWIGNIFQCNGWWTPRKLFGYLPSFDWSCGGICEFVERIKEAQHSCGEGRMFLVEQNSENSSSSYRRGKQMDGKSKFKDGHRGTCVCQKVTRDELGKPLGSALFWRGEWRQVQYNFRTSYLFLSVCHGQ